MVSAKVFLFFLFSVGSLASDGFAKLPFKVHRTDNPVDIQKELLKLQRGNGYTPVSIFQQPGFYSVNVTIGNPSSEVLVLLDTGSSDLWVNTADNPLCDTVHCATYGVFDSEKSKTLKDLDEFFGIQYLDYSFAEGYWATDDVSITDQLSVSNLQFGVANNSNSSMGVLGIGFRNLESTNKNEPLYDNLPITLKKQGLIEKVAYSLYLNSEDAQTGNVLFGGIDNAKFDGQLETFPVVAEKGNYYDLQLALSSVKVNLASGSLNSSKPINTNNAAYTLDSGTTLAILQTEAVVDIVQAITGADPVDAPGGGFQIPCSFATNNNTLDFTFDSRQTIKVPFTDLVYESDKVDSNGNDICFLAVGSSDGDFILGDIFLRHAYVVYDLEDETILIAQVKYTDDEEITVIQ